VIESDPKLRERLIVSCVVGDQTKSNASCSVYEINDAPSISTWGMPPRCRSELPGLPRN